MAEFFKVTFHLFPENVTAIFILLLHGKMEDFDIWILNYPPGYFSLSLCQQLLFIKRWTCVTVKRIIPVVRLPFRGDQINKNITSKPLDIISMVSKKIKIHICLSLSLCKKFISSYITFLRPNIDIWLYV